MKSDFFQCQTFRIIALCLGIIVFSLVVFYVGMAVGFKRGVYSVNWGENYEQNFIGPHRPALGGAPGGLMNDHGTAGEIISLNGNTVIVKEDDGMERSILTGTSTSIRLYNQSASTSDLMTGERIVVIGEPDASGQIDAEIIRVFPSNGSASTTPAQQGQAPSPGPQL